MTIKERVNKFPTLPVKLCIKATATLVEKKDLEKEDPESEALLKEILKKNLIDEVGGES